MSDRTGSGVFHRRAFLFAFLASAAACLSAAQGAAPSADEILAAVDKALFLESYASTATMETAEPGAPIRSMTFQGLSRRDKGSYLEITAPARTKGTRFLQLEGSLWMYNPKSGSANPIQLSSSDSFQGSTFANADVGKSQFSDDYSPGAAKEETIDHPEYGKVACYVIESAAKTPKSAYGKIVMWVRESDLMPVRMEYYAKSGLLFKRMTLSKVRTFGAITRPSVMTMESLEKKGAVTTLTLQSVEAREVSPAVFNKNYLKR